MNVGAHFQRHSATYDVLSQTRVTPFQSSVLHVPHTCYNDRPTCQIYSETIVDLGFC